MLFWDTVYSWQQCNWISTISRVLRWGVWEIKVGVELKVIQEAQLPQRNSASAAHMEGLGPPARSLRSLWLHLCIWSNPKPATNYVKRAVH